MGEFISEEPSEADLTDTEFFARPSRRKHTLQAPELFFFYTPNAFSFMLEMSGRGCTSPEKKTTTWTWKPKHPRMNFGGFNWMNPNHYMKNGCVLPLPSI